MPKYQLEIPHALPADDVRARLERAKDKLEQRYGASCRWAGERELEVTRTGLNARVFIEEARVRVDLELGMLMAALSGPIRAGITSQLSELLSTP